MQSIAKIDVSEIRNDNCKKNLERYVLKNCIKIQFFTLLIIYYIDDYINIYLVRVEIYLEILIHFIKYMLFKSYIINTIYASHSISKECSFNPFSGTLYAYIIWLRYIVTELSNYVGHF